MFNLDLASLSVSSLSGVWWAGGFSTAHFSTFSNNFFLTFYSFFPPSLMCLLVFDYVSVASFWVRLVLGVFLCVKVDVMVVGSSDRSRLSWRHGMKVGARFLALAIEEMMEHPSGTLAACLKGALVRFLGKICGQICEVGESEAGKACRGSSGVNAGFRWRLFPVEDHGEVGIWALLPWSSDIERVLKHNGGLLVPSRLHSGLQLGWAFYAVTLEPLLKNTLKYSVHFLVLLAMWFYQLILMMLGFFKNKRSALN